MLLLLLGSLLGDLPYLGMPFTIGFPIPCEATGDAAAMAAAAAVVPPATVGAAAAAVRDGAANVVFGVAASLAPWGPGAAADVAAAAEVAAGDSGAAEASAAGVSGVFVDASPSSCWERTARRSSSSSISTLQPPPSAVSPFAADVIRCCCCWEKNSSSLRMPLLAVFASFNPAHRTPRSLTQVPIRLTCPDMLLELLLLPLVRVFNCCSLSRDCSNDCAAAAIVVSSFV